jgi:hypothetical protein
LGSITSSTCLAYADVGTVLNPTFLSFQIISCALLPSFPGVNACHHICDFLGFETPCIFFNHTEKSFQ